MGSFLIVEAQPRGESAAPLGGVGVGYGVGPLAEQGLNHPLSLAVGLRAVGSGTFGLDTEPVAGFAERPRTVGTPVVGEHALDADAAAPKFPYCAQPETRCGVALLIGQNLDVGKARAVIDRNVGIFPARAVYVIAGIAGDPMAWAHDAAEFLGVHV